MTKTTALFITVAFAFVSNVATAEPSKKASKSQAPKQEQPVVIETKPASWHVPTFGELLLAGLESSKPATKAPASADSETTETAVVAPTHDGPEGQKVTLVVKTNKKAKPSNYTVVATSNKARNKASTGQSLALR